MYFCIRWLVVVIANNNESYRGNLRRIEGDDD